MSKVNYQKLRKRISLFEHEVQQKITCYNMGAWNEETIIACGEETCHTGEGFSINKGKNDFLTSEEMEYAKVIPLDTVLENKKISLLKMDIEGAEQNALEGAKKIIQQQTPKLAICIYHSVEDLWVIPLMIRDMFPRYTKYEMRHYANSFSETVLYASL